MINISNYPEASARKKRKLKMESQKTAERKKNFAAKEAARYRLLP
jgi:hypothetical protein